MITVLSAGSKHGPLPEATHVVDCRGMPNPYNLPALRPLDGTHPAVRKFVAKAPDYGYLLLGVRGKLNDGDTVLFYCIGGRHRSVAMAERLGEILREDGLDCAVVHHALRS